MRVISDFHDYYDSAQQYGQDQSIIYQRKNLQYCYNKTIQTEFEKIEVAPYVLINTYKKVYQKNDDAYFLSSHWCGCVSSKETGLHNYHHDRLVFCGKVYNYVIFDGRTFCYNVESVKEYFEKNKIDMQKEEYKHSKITKFNAIERALLQKTTIDEVFFVENKFICVDFCNNQITVNPNLSKMQFYKVFDSFQCFQELDTYICGKLSYPQNVMVEIEDKYRIEQHGFDKHSFRKMPTKKR